MCWQSSAAVRAHAAHLQRSLGRARLADVLRDCGPAPNARYVWSRGADYGAFGGMEHEAYVKDIPIERVAADVIIAYELNAAPASA